MKVLVMNPDLYMREKNFKVISTNNFVFRPFLASREEFFKGAILLKIILSMSLKIISFFK